MYSRVDLPGQKKVRIALYSHDTMGLGHLRRNLLIAQALAESPLRATTLVITGAHEANFFSLPPRTDFLTLPRLHKDESGRYSAGQLDISVDDLVTLRAESISSALHSFRPEVLIVDKVPTGAFGEMLPALRRLGERGGIKCVLGIRDVLDDPKTVRVENDNLLMQQTIDEFYDEIWIYGDKRVYDPIQEYQWSEAIAEKVRFTGYLDQSRRLNDVMVSSDLEPTRTSSSHERLIVCTLGGGQDGYALAHAFVEGLPHEGLRGVLLTGPFMQKQQLNSLKELAASRHNLLVEEFVPEADRLISQADCVITMGGYNSVCSVLSFGKRALLVPRVSPRLEQWIRAERLEQLGLVDVLHPDRLDASALRDWITGVAPQPRSAPQVIDMNGLQRVEQFCAALVRRNTKRQPSTSRETA